MIRTLVKNILSLLLLTTTAISAKAQQFGGNPPSIKWKQVNTPAAKVIFPAGMDSAGIRVADIVQRMNRAIQPTIGYQQKQVSIVLQNQTTIANAYVGLAPFRSEFYLTPGQNSFEIGSLPWTDQLAIHEFRHVQQYNNFNVGLSKGFRTLFGEGGQALANAIAIPDWFFEGDAVYNETHVSEQGRGRQPYFFDGYRALWDAGKNYSWMKLRNGSLRDFVPDWYPMGYMLVAYGREKYGDDFWKNVTHDAASFKDVFYPMQKAIKKYSGKDFTQFRNDGLNYFKQQFNVDEETPHSLIHSTTLPIVIGTFINQEYPAYINDNTVVYMKSTYNYLPVFVINTDGAEKEIAIRAVSLDNYFNYHDGKIVYASYRPDLRWGYRDYSELRVLDIKTGNERLITRKTKYFSPAFSDDGKRIVAVQQSAEGKNAIHLLDAKNGKLLEAVPNKNNLFFTYPKFYGDDQLVSAVRNAKGEMSLALIDIKTGDTKYLLPFSYRPIAFPIVQGDTVYFSATSWGTGNHLFAALPGKNFVLKMDETSISKYQPAVTSNKLAWVEFTAYGYKLKQADKNTKKWSPIVNPLADRLSDFNISTLKKDSATNLLATINTTPLPVTKYNKAYHLFNFHSLIPDFNDPNYTLSLTGENVLNTFQSELSFNYNRDEGYKKIGFNAVYGALFPYLQAGAGYIIDRRSYYKGSNVYYNESDVHAGVQVPLNFSAGRQLTGLSIGSSIYYTRNSFQQAYKTLFRDRDYTYLNNSITFINHIQQAKQNIYPRLGESITFNYKTAINGLTANQFLASGTFYFPGLLVNHNLVINVAHQQKGVDNVVSFSNNFPFSRGYTAENLHSMNKVGANYHFPLVYPDAGVANTLYFLRIRGNLFYDYTHATDTYTSGALFKADFRTAGAELYFDTKWFNQQSLTFGIRYSRLLDNDLFGGNGRNRIEVVLPVSFF